MRETICCPSCRRKLMLPEEVLGRQVRCPACTNTFRAEISPAPPLPVDDVPYAEEVQAAPGRRPQRPRSRRSLWNELEAEGPPRARKRKLSPMFWIVGGLVAVVVLLVGLFVVGFLVSSSQRQRVAVRETPEQRRQVLRAAFSRPVPLAQPDPALKALFTDLGDALQKKDQARVQSAFDGERMYDEVVAQGLVAPLGQGNQKAFGRGLTQGLSRSLFHLAWTSFEIRNIAWRGDKEAAVIVRHHKADGLDLKMRWFLSRESGAWKIYDFEDLRAGTRISVTAALLANQAGGNTEPMTRACNNIRDAGRAVDQGNLDQAELLLRQAQLVHLPRAMTGLIHAIRAEIHLLRRQPREALDCLVQAEVAHPDMPLIGLLRGTAHNQLGEWDKALEHLQAYQELLGDEEGVCLQLGEALRNKERFAEAAVSYRKSLDLNPKNINSFLGLMYSLAATDRHDDIPGRFALLDNHQESYQTCVEALRQARCWDGVVQLAEVMHTLQPGYTPATYELCLAQARAGHGQQAADLFRTQLARQKDPALRRQHLTGFLEAMAQAGKPLEAYGAAPEPRPAFAVLAPALKKSYRFQDLEALVEVHGKKEPKDPLLPFYQGEVLVHQERYAEAERVFAAAMSRRPDRATVEPFRASRVLARYHGDRPLSAYDDIGPKQETFEQLAELLLQDDRPELLGKLLAVHGRTHPNDPLVPRFRMRALIQQEKVDAGIALFKAELARPLQKEQREALVAVFLREMLAVNRSLEAYKAAPDPGHAFKLLAENLMEEDYDMEALAKLVEAHRHRPLNPTEQIDLATYEAEVLTSRKQWGQAVRLLETIWPSADEERRGQLRYRYVNALYQNNQVRRAYDTVPPRKETFEQLANLLLQDKKGKELEELIAAHRPHAGQDPDTDYFAARARVLLGRPEEGQKLLEQAYKNQPEVYRRQMYVSQFCRDLTAAGKPLQAYRSAPDRQAAFTTIAGMLLAEKKAAELQALLDEHGKGKGKDPAVLRNRGELALLQGKPAQAEPFFTEALALSPSHEQWTIRAALARARVRSGKTVAVYEQSGFKPEVFEELSQACLQEKDAVQLGALLGARRKAHPEDPTLPSWELEVKWLLHDYQGVCKLIAEHRQGLFAGRSYRWKADDYLVRSLVKLGRSTEAVQEVEALARQHRGYPLLTILAHAAHGGATEAIAALEKPSRERVSAEACYQDADLGPLLRSEAFAAFRKKYPPPRKGA